jgi:hypothetical protein
MYFEQLNEPVELIRRSYLEQIIIYVSLTAIEFIFSVAAVRNAITSLSKADAQAVQTFEALW